jgi:hypothetical protein
MSADRSKIPIERTQTLDSLLHQVLNLALVRVGAEAGSLMLVDNKRGILQIKARLGKPQAGRKQEVVFKKTDQCIAAHVVETQRSYLCPNVQKDPLFAPSRSGQNFASLLAVPIVYQGKVLAVINADDSRKGRFSKADLQRLEGVAREAAEAIANRISPLEALTRVGVELARSPREGGVGAVLDKIAHLALQSLGADIVTVYQYDQAKDYFPVEGTEPTIAGEIRDPTPMRRKVYPGDVPWTVVHQRKSDFYSDVSQQSFLKGEVDRPGDTPRLRFIEREGIKSMAALLLPHRAADNKSEQVVGVMFANYRSPHEFNIDEIDAVDLCRLRCGSNPDRPARGAAPGRPAGDGGSYRGQLGPPHEPCNWFGSRLIASDSESPAAARGDGSPTP